MVLPTQVNRVHVHAAIVRPIIGESDEQLDANFGCCIHHLVEGLNVNGRGTIGKSLEDDLGLASPFTTILR